VVKYAGLSSQGEFVPIAAESYGPINRDDLQLLSELGKRLVETTRDVRASSFLFQRMSAVVPLKLRLYGALQICLLLLLLLSGQDTRACGDE